MNRSLKQKLAAGAAVVVVLVGAAVAAMTASGEGPSYGAAGHPSAHRVVLRQLAPAASYLGVAPAQLESDLASGKTLAQVADATSGKSAAGLIEALIAERRQKLALAAANVTKRVTAEVNRVGVPAPRAAGSRALEKGAAPHRDGQRLFAAPSRLGFVAASYLGVSAAQLQSELKSGKTLAEVADATSGKSAAGLIQSLVAARQARINAAVASGKLTASKASTIDSKLMRRMTIIANRPFGKRGLAASKG
jgi:hypothetical protein